MEQKYNEVCYIAFRYHHLYVGQFNTNFLEISNMFISVLMEMHPHRCFTQLIIPEYC
jgi:hypothetical protein